MPSRLGPSCAHPPPGVLHVGDDVWQFRFRRQAVVDRDDDESPFGDLGVEVVVQPLPRAHDQGAAVDPEHGRLARRGGMIDVRLDLALPHGLIDVRGRARRLGTSNAWQCGGDGAARHDLQKLVPAEAIGPIFFHDCPPHWSLTWFQSARQSVAHYSTILHEVTVIHFTPCRSSMAPLISTFLSLASAATFLPFVSLTIL